MAKSLDDLIEFLLEEIANSGSRGVTINEIATFVASFYQAVKDDQVSTSSHAETSNPAPVPAVTVDRPLLAKVWTWLGRHPDVSIGDDRKYNKATLAQVESEFPGCFNLPTSKAILPDGNDPDSRKLPKAPSTPNTPPKGRAAESPRFRVNEKRFYQAICGHPPDTSKVAPLEFDLLSHIAVTRSEGILQGELVRLSGQDKRSVPRRTDGLHAKGYIIKEFVYRKGVRTSRLVLTKFAPSSVEDEDGLHEYGGRIRHGSSVRDAVRRIFDILADQALIPQASLAKELSLGRPAESAVLSKIIRRLDRLRCVKRVRTAVGPSATSGDLKRFVQLLHPPDAKDLDRFDTDGLSLDQSIEELASLSEAEFQSDLAEEAEEVDDHVEEGSTGHHLASWTPDRPITNVVRDAAQLVGRAGLTNWGARRLITGMFIRRQIESLLLRVSCQSLVLQPAHLRHLAVIRASLTVDGVAQYLHYSWNVFCQLVAEHKVDITQIEGATQIFRPSQRDGASSNDISVPTSSLQTDEFGFAVTTAPSLQFRNGEADLSTLVRVGAASDVPSRAGEPDLVNEGGVLSLKPHESESARRLARAKNGPPRQPRQSRQPRPPRPPPTPKVRGRPRKYMAGTESFWQRQVKQLKAKNGAGSPSKPKGSKKDSPETAALYAGRPANFDPTLVKAISAGLPVPNLQDDINEHWVTSTQAILDRRSEGVYITPPGLRHDNAKRPSQIMIIKNSRLKALDWFDERNPQAFHSISSSAAHSSAVRGHDAALATKPSSVQQSPRKARRSKRMQTGDETEKEAGPAVEGYYEEPTATRPDESLAPTSADVDLPLERDIHATDEEPEIRSQSDRHNRATSQRLYSPSPTETQDFNLQTSEHIEDAQPAVEAVPVSKTPKKPRPIPPVRSSRKRKPTEKAVDLSQSAKRRKLQLHSEARSTLHDASTEKSKSPGSPIGTSHVEESSERALGGQTPEVGPVPHLDTSEADIENEAQPMEGVVLEKDGLQPHLEEHNLRANSTVPESIQNASIDPQEKEPTPGQATTTAPPPNGTRSVEHISSSNIGDIAAEPPVTPTKSRAKRRVSKPKRPSGDEPYDSGDAADASRRGKRPDEGAQKYTPHAGALTRKIILQLIAETCGVVPSDSYTLKRIMTPRWHEAGEEGRPLLSTIKRAIKTLCEQGNVKQVTFTFRGKTGIMVKRTVLFLPQINPQSTLVEEVKQKIIDAEPTDYIPPEWTVEGSRVPLVGKRAASVLSDAESAPPKRRRRASSAVSDATVASSLSRSTRSVTRAATPEVPPATPATGFLSLKVPKIGSLPAVEIYNWKTQTPVTALRFDVAASPPPKQPRNSRKPASQTTGRTIVWANESSPKPPSSLQDILSRPDLKIRFEDVQSEDGNWQRFACEVEGVRAWEEQETEAFLSQRSTYAFINHTVPAALYADAPGLKSAEVVALIQFDEDGVETEVSLPPAESWPTFVSALASPPEVMERIAGVPSRESTPPPPPNTDTRARRTTRPSKRKADALVDDFDPDVEPEPTPRRGAGGRKPKAVTTSIRRRAGAKARPKVPPEAKLHRKSQVLRKMPGEMIYRIAVSVVVVRTLAGGLESYVDWPLVMTTFPGHQLDFVRDRWKTLFKKYYPDVKGLTESLQRKYLQALEAGAVPSVDFENLKATNWPGIVDWALKNLDRFNVKQMDDLPATRQAFFESHSLAFNEPKRWHNLLTYGGSNVTGPVREDVAGAVVFGVPCSDASAASTKATDPPLRLARSWVLAAILTPDANFDPTLTRAKLSTLAADPAERELLLGRALALLHEEKLIQRRQTHNKGEQPSSLRIWEGSRRLFEQFEDRRMVTARMLRRAAAYKLDVLDRAFAADQKVTVPKNTSVDDGDMVAVVNLVAAGQLRVRAGPDVPDTRYGLDWERVGYKTKSMDKDAICFGVQLSATDTYEFGGDGSAVPIPGGSEDVLPPWIDIHGRLQVLLWDMFVGGVVGLVSQMPGATAGELSRALGSALDDGHVAAILDWLVRGGFAKHHPTSKGYETTERWWLCLGPNHAEGGN